jgi:hypothetical protein
LQIIQKNVKKEIDNPNQMMHSGVTEENPVGRNLSGNT